MFLNKIFFRKRQKNALIVIPAPHGSCQQAKSGIISTISGCNELDIEYNIINGNNEADEISYELESYLTYDNYDVIFTLGAMCTKVSKDVTTRMRKYVPIVFGGVINPVEEGIVPSINYTGNHVSGIAAQLRSYEEELRKFLAMRRSTRKIGILQSKNTLASSPIGREISSIVDVLRRQGIESKMVFYQSLEGAAFNQVVAQAHDIDVLIIPRQNITLLHIDILVTFCNQRGILLYASDIESVKKGAAIGFGDFEYLCGVRVAEKAIALLLNRKSLVDHAVLPLDWHGRMVVNAATMQQQNLNVAVTRLLQEKIAIIV